MPGRRIVPLLILASIILPTAARAVYYVFIPASARKSGPVLEYVRETEAGRHALRVPHFRNTFRYYRGSFRAGKGPWRA